MKELEGIINLKPDSVVKISDLKEGIWAVRNIPKGKQMTYIMERVDDLPNALKLTQMEAIRYDISKEITEALVNADVMRDFRMAGHSVRRVVNDIFKTLRRTLK